MVKNKSNVRLPNSEKVGLKQLFETYFFMLIFFLSGMISGYGKRGGGYGRGISEQGLFYHFKFRAQQLFISSYTSPSVIFKKHFRFILIY